jgi:inhibitor of cysteine peptidase
MTSKESAPSLLNSVSVNGSQVAARVSQGYLYEMVQQPSFGYDANGNVTAESPTIVEKGVSSVLSPGATYYTPNKSQISVYTMIMSMSMSTGSQQSVAVLTGPSSTVYVSTSNIYVVYPNYPSYYVDGIQGDVFGGSAGPASIGVVQQPQNSTVVRVAYSNGVLGADAAGSFPGVVLNQFSMDEYGGYFRVATSRAVSDNGTNSRSDDVYVLDQNFTQVGALRNLAPGENIYSVLFSGAVGYVVTFEQVDPLFAISFANPTNPVVLSALKVSGFSDYLYPFGNAYLIGVGKDAVASSTGNFAYYLGMKLSLFHVASDGTSTEVANYMIGDRGTDSPVLNDHLAFTFDSARNITVIPVDLAKVSGSQTQPPGSPPPFGQMVWQGAYVFSVSPSGFDLLGTVTQYPPGSGSNSFYGGSGGHDIYRSVIIGNALYTISQDEVMVSDLTSFSTLATVKLG